MKKRDRTGSKDDSTRKSGSTGVIPATKRKLANFSGNQCANPDCNVRLVDPNTLYDIGQVAHIAGEKEGSARFDPKMTDQQRNGISNLLFLCASCHVRVDQDKEGQHYSVDLLTQWKTQREKADLQDLSGGFASLEFSELEEATDWLLKQTPNFDSPNPDFSLIEIKNKINKHDLSPESQYIILEGCSRLNDVERFIEERTIEDSTPPPLPDRLKARILKQYYTCILEGQTGDELFTSMVQYMRKGFDRYEVQSASLSILVYYFEKCDIFSD